MDTSLMTMNLGILKDKNIMFANGVMVLCQNQYHRRKENDMVHINDTPLTFGKYKGITPNEIAGYDPQYLVWAYENTKQKVCNKDLYESCCEDVMEYEAEKEYDLHFGLDGW